MSKTKSIHAIEDEYEEKDLRTHIYENSDTYAGSDEMIKCKVACMKGQDKDINISDIEYIPVIYKCFDEIIVNARDQGRFYPSHRN